MGLNRSKERAHRHPLVGSPELEKFKKDLIAKQVAAREKDHKTAVIKLERSELGPIANDKEMHKDIAPLFMKMWEEAKKDHRARKGATGTDSIGVASGYRSAEQDARAWQHAFPKYYNATLEKRLATGDGFGREALEIIFHFMNGKKAPPGFSGHTHGIAADLTTKENGKTWTVNSDYDHQLGWQKTWLYGWLVANAWKHNFYQLKTETWHWEYHKGNLPTQCWGGQVKHRPVSKAK